MMTRTTLFRSNQSQAVRLPKSVAFESGIKDVVVIRDGSRRIIVPADGAWDDFFAMDGVDLGERDQPEMQMRDAL